MFELGTVYIRSIVAVVSICAMFCYLHDTESLKEALAAIVLIVYIDKKISGNQE
jgi:hypothetical protein